MLARAVDNPLIDILTAAMAVATRRAGELGEAITARGGTGQLTAHPNAPGLRDALALVLVFGVCLGSVALHLLL
jgi:energy-coupling factor transport system permease protein